ncbi:MAG: GNVR domain-containing protein [Sphingobium sp.]|uniref:GNVR domain-containing protein n=1 Tax=Sphingobium sp. TaxID=1912891 RepID=UPI0029A433A5|nr:GNVR domain-containing protein [Sphingobium sp.]MDX3908905.1 GNVR domain-containing protein [Sphingobium sp.]
MHLADLIRAVLVRWRLEVAIFLGVLLLAVIWIAVTPRTYIASASMLVDSRAPDPVSAEPSQSSKATSTLATEAKIIRSEAIASQVADKLGMKQRPDLKERWMEETGRAQTYDGWLARGLLSGLSVATSETDNVMTLSYKSSDPQKAAQMANAFADSYVDVRLRMSTDPAKTYADWFEKRIAEVRAKLVSSQQALSDFQRARGIISTGSIDAESTRLGELSSQLSNAEAQAADARARANVGGSAMPEVQTSGVIQGLRSQIASKSAVVQQMRSELGSAHPMMQAAQAELSELQARLASETGKTAGMLGAASAASTSREGQIRGLLSGQRNRMLAQAADRSKLEVLESDTASARREYDSVTQQLASMRLRSTVPATNIRLLDKAETPMLPTSPDVVMRLLMAMMFGLMLAVGVAVALEWRRPRIRNVASLVHLTGAPVLGTVHVTRALPQPSGEATT